jgi:natural product precursor
MRKIGKIKLNQFSKDELEQRKMNELKGGCVCGLTCNCPCINDSTYADGGTIMALGGSGVEYIYNY